MNRRKIKFLFLYLSLCFPLSVIYGQKIDKQPTTVSIEIPDNLVSMDKCWKTVMTKLFMEDL